jgi:hypothetical protein
MTTIVCTLLAAETAMIASALAAVVRPVWSEVRLSEGDATSHGLDPARGVIAGSLLAAGLWTAILIAFFDSLP